MLSLILYKFWFCNYWEKQGSFLILSSCMIHDFDFESVCEKYYLARKYDQWVVKEWKKYDHWSIRVVTSNRSAPF